jgi:hypothetical protein
MPHADSIFATNSSNISPFISKTAAFKAHAGEYTPD